MQQSSPFLMGFGRFLESRIVGLLLNFVVIPILILLFLYLPPIQLVERIQNFGHTAMTASAGELMDPDGTQIIFPADGLSPSRKTYARLSSTPQTDFERGETGEELRRAAANLPDFLRPRSPLYQLSLRGAVPDHVIAIIPIPNDSLPYETLDIYNWNGQTWEWLPHNIDVADDVITMDVNVVPHAFMVVQTNTQLPAVSVDLPAQKTLPADAQAATTAIFPAVLRLRGDGSVDGTEFLPQDSVPYDVFVTSRNYESDEIPRTDLLANLVIDEQGMQAIQINTLAELAASNLYAGIGIDYRGVDPPLRADFSHFIFRLAQRLHEDGKKLAVFVDKPVQIADNTWETFGYDWRALGASADILILPGYDNPLDYAPGGAVESMLNWAVGEVDRSKLQLTLPARSVEQAGNYFLYRGYGEALAPITGQVTVNQNVVEPGDSVTASLSADIVASPLQFDPATGISWYRYRGQSGEERIVFLEDASSLASKITVAKRFNLGGVYVQALESTDIDANTWSVLSSYASGQSPAQSESQRAIVWQVTDSQGNVVNEKQTSLNEAVTLDIPGQPGDYMVAAGLLDGNRMVSDQGEASVAVATYTPTPTPTPEFTPTPVPTPTPVATATPTPLPYAVAQATGTTNLRKGPGTAYDRVGQLAAGEQLKIIGKNKDGSWWQLAGPKGDPVWIIASRVEALGPVAAVQVAQNIPKAPKRPTSPVASGSHALPAGAGSFGYGIQIQPYGGADIAFAANAIRGLGFNWVKWQVPWEDMEGTQGQIGWQDDLTNYMAGQGLKILASIVKAPNWARPANTDFGVEGPPADPQTYANFVGAYAGHYCGKVQAIEVWNEQNLYYEWGSEPLDAARYMQILKAAYQSIKAACPNMIVVSGALTPAGNVGALAVDDFTYLEQMYQNGLKDWSDGIGVHPSGYNVPPTVGWQQACDFITADGASFHGACDNPHHSWSARSTIEGYRNIMLKYGDVNKRLWPTEFGWAAGGALDPNYGYANDNTYEEQAQWTVQFYEFMRSTGYVGPAILWNLNFGITNPGTELAQWGILDANGGPRPVYNALAAMPK